MNVLVAQVQDLAARQEVLEKKGVKSTEPVGAATAPSAGNVDKLPAVSDGLAFAAGPPLDAPKALNLIGPPPRTRMNQAQLNAALPPPAPEEPGALMMGADHGGDPQGSIVNALSHQSNALTALVAHLASQAGDPHKLATRLHELLVDEGCAEKGKIAGGASQLLNAADPPEAPSRPHPAKDSRGGREFSHVGVPHKVGRLSQAEVAWSHAVDSSSCYRRSSLCWR